MRVLNLVVSTSDLEKILFETHLCVTLCNNLLDQEFSYRESNIMLNIVYYSEFNSLLW